MSAAVLVIDIQEDFFRIEYADQELGQKVKHELVANINQLTSAARQAQIVVFFALTSLPSDPSAWNLRMRDIQTAGCIKGTPGEAPAQGLVIEARDVRVYKTRYTAFFRTNLEQELAARGVDTLIVCGINTHACVRMAAVDAFMRDLRVFIPEECTASYDREQHDTSLKYMSRRIGLVVPLAEMLTRIREGNLTFRFTD